MILYFENSRGQRRQVAETATAQEAFVKIQEFLKSHDFVSYYSRYWTNPDNPKERVVDVGSHSEFFYIYNEEGWSDELS